MHGQQEYWESSYSAGNQEYAEREKRLFVCLTFVIGHLHVAFYIQRSIEHRFSWGSVPRPDFVALWIPIQATRHNFRKQEWSIRSEHKNLSNNYTVPHIGVELSLDNQNNAWGCYQSLQLKSQRPWVSWKFSWCSEILCQGITWLCVWQMWQNCWHYQT